MKITEVETVILRQPALDAGIADGSQDDLVVIVRTDEGVTGIGEVDSAPEAVRALIEAPDSHAVATSMRRLLVGEDPCEVEALWHRLYRGIVYVGRRGIAVHALSGVDIALWDIKGKVEGRAVCELLGERRRDRVRAYASLLMPETVDGVRAVVEAVCERGFTALKLGWGPLGRDPRHDIRLAEVAVETADGRLVLIDAGLGYGRDVTAATYVARALEELGVGWLEEPFEPDEYEAYRALADAVEVPVAAGEQESTVWGFRELIERGAVDVIQPDVTRCGGITELLRIAADAEERGVRTVPHAWKSGIIKAASLHVNAVLPGEPLQEYCIAETPINTSLTRQRFLLDADGYVAVPTEPGLGVDLDEDVVARYEVR